MNPKRVFINNIFTEKSHNNRYEYSNSTIVGVVIIRQHRRCITCAYRVVRPVIAAGRRLLCDRENNSISSGQDDVYVLVGLKTGQCICCWLGLEVRSLQEKNTPAGWNEYIVLDNAVRPLRSTMRVLCCRHISGENSLTIC